MADDIILSSISDLDSVSKLLNDDLFLVTTKDKNGIYVSNKVDFQTISSSFGLKSMAFRRDSEFSPSNHLHDSRYSNIYHDHDLVYSKIGHVHSEYLSAIPQANDSTIGGFKTGFTENETERGVKIRDGRAYVTVSAFMGGEGHVMMSKDEYQSLPEEYKLSDVVYMLSDDNQCGSSVYVNPIITSGTKIAEITVDGNKKDIYSPDSSGGSTMATPVGTIIAWTGLSSDEKIPEGYLICNGQEVSKGEYSDLYNVVGDKFGVASSSDKFKLPLLTDERYLQGNLSAGMDISAGLPNISGQITGLSCESSGEHVHTIYSHYKATGTGSSDTRMITDTEEIPLSCQASGNHTHNITGSATIIGDVIYGNSTTVTPKSMTVIYLICYKVIGTYIGGGYGGGVIDGTALRTYELSVDRVAQATQKEDVNYEVQNDCLLVIKTDGTDFATGGYGASVKVNGKFVGTLLDTLGGEYPKDYPSLAIPVKKGCQITFDRTKSDTTNQNIWIVRTTAGQKVVLTFIEYKLNSLAPQIAMPDWNESKNTSLSTNTPISKNGYIVCSPQPQNNETFWIKINRLTVGKIQGAVGEEIASPVIIPVSKNDVFSIVHGKDEYGIDIGTVATYDHFTWYFLPCKSVPQQTTNEPIVISSWYETTVAPFNGGKEFNWGRIYSNGWCEQGGRYFHWSFDGEDCGYIYLKCPYLSVDVGPHSENLSSNYMIDIFSNCENNSNVKLNYDRIWCERFGFDCPKAWSGFINWGTKGWIK